VLGLPAWEDSVRTHSFNMNDLIWYLFRFLHQNFGIWADFLSCFHSWVCFEVTKWQYSRSRRKISDFSIFHFAIIYSGYRQFKYNSFKCAFQNMNVAILCIIEFPCLSEEAYKQLFGSSTSFWSLRHYRCYLNLIAEYFNSPVLNRSQFPRTRQLSAWLSALAFSQY